MVDVPFAWVVGTVILLVGPLYARAAKEMVRDHNVVDNEEDIEANAEAVQEIRQSVSNLEMQMRIVHNDLQVIHDLVADSNHCGAAGCRWCEPEEGDFVGDDDQPTRSE